MGPGSPESTEEIHMSLLPTAFLGLEEAGDKEWGSHTTRNEKWPQQFGSVDRALAHGPKGLGFHSSQGQVPRLQA